MRHWEEERVRLDTTLGGEEADLALERPVVKDAMALGEMHTARHLEITDDRWTSKGASDPLGTGGTHEKEGILGHRSSTQRLL